MTYDPHFTKAEATALVGKRFTHQRESSGIPEGTTGKVIAIDKESLGHWDVIVEWDLPRARLSDLFTKEEMERYMREVKDA